MSKCNLCPRKCGIDREKEKGYCGVSDSVVVSKIMLHHGEEPVISGSKGSGAIFFSGCNLRCVYCQNGDISSEQKGEIMTSERIKKEMFALKERGAHNINLVTAGHYAHKLIPILKEVKKDLAIPIVYNTSAYEDESVIKALDGLVDVYLPDYKYAFSDLAQKYSGASDYPEVAQKAIAEMVRQKGKCVVKDGLIREGVIIRHLVLPGAKDNGIAVMERIASDFKGALVSIMRQYTPQFNRSQYKCLNRRITSYEYDAILKRAVELGLDGFTQQKGCETALLTPDFNQIY